jgi:DNA-binding HxlR family transcriptional regulator
MRSYQQFCPAARALDVVGERWTLLVVRELLFGPKRYTDLQAGLPGIGPNVLSDRLRSLESANVLRRRRLPPPAASTVYELTELGRGLRPVVFGLFEWGLRLTGEPTSNDVIRASYWLPAIEAAAQPQAVPPDADDTYEFRVGEEIVSVTVRNGRIDVRQGATDSPDVVLSTDAWTFVALGRGELSPLEAIKAGKLSVEGDPAAAERCAAVFATTTDPRVDPTATN